MYQIQIVAGTRRPGGFPFKTTSWSDQHQDQVMLGDYSGRPDPTIQALKAAGAPRGPVIGPLLGLVSVGSSILDFGSVARLMKDAPTVEELPPGRT